ncbi:HNH endonuclease [Turicibacter sanguinis]|uniref:HNH endonuclease n=1 Tax=Turicibacter sanguinis TaxID=154288 RepID=UPI0012BB8262|nr:hypothetical protein [Turicibacter sanguinis]MDB8437301.1 hypothetical protein [Turicibacter sanguinis]MTO22784.1 hypothetical protein [Turicibacter sanguinis]MTO25919.1 hypothetical protein [Turicibacter sanguinis]MTO88825.1 hypothetical protein [Turicibacter sanguinis]MTP68731.1 hypothetical protein [Turicibacter sanguinis]
MWSVSKPSEDYKEILEKCISTITRKKELKTKLEKSKEFLISENRQLEKLIIAHQTFTIKAHSMVNNILTQQEMMSLYTNKLSKAGQPARIHYDKIISLPKLGICPFCGHNTATTLDHYLPKQSYPTYAISPINLVASCKDCNTTKSTHGFEEDEKVLIHPYFEEIDDVIWLKAEIIEEMDSSQTNLLTFNFYVTHPEHWDTKLFKRVENQFMVLRLNKLFSTQAAQGFINRYQRYINVYRDSGKEELKHQLEEEIQSYEMNHLNSWEVAFLRALRDSEWFFNNFMKNNL